MKRFVHSILLLAIAVAVFFTGAGVTVVNYCCTTCSEQTFLMMDHQCGTQAHHSEESADCCSSHNTPVCEAHTSGHDSDEHCSASRLSIDLDSSMSRPHVATPFVWISDASLFLIKLLPEDKVDTAYEEHIEAPPTLPPRSYLSLIRVLII